MSPLQILGIGMVASVIAGAFGASVVAFGLRLALGLWAFSVAVTAFIAVGMGLATGGLR